MHDEHMIIARIKDMCVMDIVSWLEAQVLAAGEQAQIGYEMLVDANVKE